MSRREYFHHVDHRKKQRNSKLTLWITFIITLIFTIVEFVGSVLSNSLALLSDSFHMLEDESYNVINNVSKLLENKYNIKHTTLQIENLCINSHSKTYYENLRS